MKKLFCVIVFCLWVIPGVVAQVSYKDKMPDNMYLQAMKDEMQRSIKRLRLKDNPNPYYLAYKLVKRQNLFDVTGSMGALYAQTKPETTVQAWVLVSTGNDAYDSLGMDGYTPTSASSLSDSYDGLRQDLWMMTDIAYVNALDAYKQKQTYYRQKNTTERLPDVIPAAQGRWAGPLLEPQEYEVSAFEELARTFSAAGKEYPYIEDFRVRMAGVQNDYYFVNSRGGFYQYSWPYLTVSLQVKFRSKDGFKKRDYMLLQFTATPENFTDVVEQKVNYLLQRVQDTYEAKPAESYIGPVLLRPEAAAELVDRLFVQEISNQKALLSLSKDTDPTAGTLYNRLGKRVMSNVVDVEDSPLSASWQDTYLLKGFAPIDDEGVIAQPLTLVSGGVLQAIPRTTRPLEKGAQSNGHARASKRVLPREQLTNVIVTAKEPLDEGQLTEKLLDRCKELEMEYCYIMDVLPIGEGTDYYASLLRIYTQDGHIEPVNGLTLQGLTGRALRDIVAAGDDQEVFSSSSDTDVSIVVPSLLLEELELTPLNLTPDRKTFINRP